MADAVTMVKLPSESPSAFNKRLREACNMQAVTDASLSVVDGQPVVTLFSEMVAIEQKDIDEAQEAGDELPKLGEMVPEEDPIIAQVSKLSCVNDEEAAKSQAFMEKLYDRAQGNVVNLLYAVGSIFGFLKGPDGKDIYCEQAVNYALVSYVAEPDEGDQTGQDAKMDQTLRKGGKVD